MEPAEILFTIKVTEDAEGTISMNISEMSRRKAFEIIEQAKAILQGSPSHFHLSTGLE